MSSVSRGVDSLVPPGPSRKPNNEGQDAMRVM